MEKHVRLIGESPQIRDVLRRIELFAPLPEPLLLVGESGTGKEVAARLVHRLSGRPGRFVPVNCATLKDALAESELFGHVRGAFTGAVANKRGMMEEAQRGTFLLDEIGELTLGLQSKLLRALEEGTVRRVGENQERPFEARVLAATNRDLSTLREKGLFRGDLFWRLRAFEITLPPLRERRQDIPLLVEHFAHGRRVSTEAMSTMERYDWPGNVRELANTVAYAKAIAGVGEIRQCHLPGWVDAKEELRAACAFESSLDACPVLVSGRAGFVVSRPISFRDLAREYFEWVLDGCSGNKAEAARRLNIDQKTLKNKLRSA